MTFKDCIAADIHSAYLNPDEFSERRTVLYDGAAYEDIPVSLQAFSESDRERVTASGSGRSGADSASGLHQNTVMLYCARTDLGGRTPAPNKTIKISTAEGSSRFREYYVVSSECEMGMLQIELRAVRGK